MMQHVAMVAAVLRKDLRLFWPLAVTVAALIVTDRMDSLVITLGPDASALLSVLVQVALPLAVITFAILVIHEDAAVSANHEWLTRPIPGRVMLTAKFTFMVLTLIGSSIVGQVLDELYRGYGLVDALLGGLAWGAQANTWMVLIGFVALASLTSNLRQAVVLAVAAAVGLSAVWYLSASASGMLYARGRFGNDWIVERGLLLVVALTGLGVLWLQYVRRNVRASWSLILLSTAGTGILLSVLSWPRGFAIQKALAAQPEVAERVIVEPASGCFTVSRVSDVGGLFSAANLGNEFMEIFATRNREPADIIFSTTLVARELPPDSKLVVDRVVASYRQAGKDVDSTLQLARHTAKWTEIDGVLAAQYFWLLPRSEYVRLAALDEVELRLNYSLSVLAPTASFDLVADEQRQFYPGIGHCFARRLSLTSNIEASCLKMGSQPALLFAKVSGAAEIEGRSSGAPNYVPAALDFLGGKRHWWPQLASRGGDENSRIQITAYEAQAHFDRQIVTAGILGGPTTKCPAPGAD